MKSSFQLKLSLREFLIALLLEIKRIYLLLRDFADSGSLELSIEDLFSKVNLFDWLLTEVFLK